MKHLKKIAKTSVIVFFGAIFVHFFNYLYRLIVARIGVAEYGLYNLGLAVYNILMMLSLFGIQYGILRYIPYYKSKKDYKKAGGVIGSAIKINLSFGILLSLLTFLLAPLVAVRLFHNASLIPVLRFFALLLPITLLVRIFLLGLQALQRIDYVVSMDVIFNGLLKVLLASLFITLGFGLFGALFASAFPPLFLSLTAFYLVKKLLPSMSLNLPINKELLLYSGSMMAVYILNTAIQWLDTLMLGYFKTSYDVGLYSVALPTASLIFIIPSSLTTLFLPIITSIYARGRSIHHLYSIITRWIFYVTFPITLFVALFSKQIIVLLFGRDYLAASLPLVILMGSFMLNSLFVPSTYILMMLKKTKVLVFVSFVAMFLSLTLNYLLIPLYSINGAAVATGISFLFYGFAIRFYGYKFTKIRLFSKSYLKVAVLGLIAISITYSFYIITALWKFKYSVILMFVLFIPLYLLLLILFRCLEREDKNILKGVRKRIRMNIPLMDEMLR